MNTGPSAGSSSASAAVAVPVVVRKKASRVIAPTLVTTTTTSLPSAAPQLDNNGHLSSAVEPNAITNAAVDPHFNQSLAPANAMTDSDAFGNNAAFASDDKSAFDSSSHANVNIDAASTSYSLKRPAPADAAGQMADNDQEQEQDQEPEGKDDDNNDFDGGNAAAAEDDDEEEAVDPVVFGTPITATSAADLSMIVSAPWLRHTLPAEAGDDGAGGFGSVVEQGRVTSSHFHPDGSKFATCSSGMLKLLLNFQNKLI